MYKKISIALCIVISLFFIVPLIYLWWTMESPQTPSLIKGPFIALYLRNLTSSPTNRSGILLYDIPNSDFTLDRDVWEWNNASFPAQVSKSILLECHSNVPVKWEYRGEGGLVSEMRHHDRREIKEFSDNSTYFFTSGVELLEISEQISGQYVCASIDSGKEVSLHLFVRGFRTFITNEDSKEEVGRDAEIVIPCSLADPDKSWTVGLRVLLENLSTPVYHTVDPENIIDFDPKLGFRLKPNNYGSYRCVDPNSSDSSGLIRILKPRDEIVTGDSHIRTITTPPIPKNESALRVLCEATEAVTLNFINFHPFKRRQVYHVNDSSAFPHSSRIILRNEWFTNYSTVECRTQRDGRVLRVWTYVKRESSDKTTFHFNPDRKLYECCTEPGTTGIIPVLTQASCYTQAECDMKRTCLSRSKCPTSSHNPVYEPGQGCAVAQVANNPSGLLQCAFGNATKSYLYFYGRSGLSEFTSTNFRKKKVQLTKLLRIVQEPRESYGDAEFVTFTCSGPRFFFANGFQWAVKTRVGKPEFVSGGSAYETAEDASESISLPISQVESKIVACYAPITFSHEWVNATVKYRPKIVSTTEYDDS